MLLHFICKKYISWPSKKKKKQKSCIHIYCKEKENLYQLLILIKLSFIPKYSRKKNIFQIIEKKIEKVLEREKKKKKGRMKVKLEESVTELFRPEFSK